MNRISEIFRMAYSERNRAIIGFEMLPSSNANFQYKDVLKNLIAMRFFYLDISKVFISNPN